MRAERSAKSTASRSPSPPHPAPSSPLVPLWPWQARWVESKAPLRIAGKARQIGWSWAMALDATLRAVVGRNQILVSRTARQSRKLMAFVYQHLDALAAAGCAAARRPKGATETTTECRIASGAEIVALPAKPETIRGYTGDVHLDEFALHADADAILAALAPAATLGYHVAITSTPWGDSNRFARLFHEAMGHGYELHAVTIHDAIAAGFPADLAMLHALVPDPDLFAQEYEIAFVSGADSFFPHELLASRIADAPGADRDALVTVGVDVARSVDLTAIAVLVLRDGKAYVRDVTTMRGVPLPEQTQRVHEAAIAAGAYRVAVDATGMGLHMAEDLARRGPYAVDQVTFSPPVKERLATTARAALDRGDLLLCDDRDLLADFHAIRRIVGSGGALRFDAERNERGHADRFWAVALALSAMPAAGRVGLSDVEIDDTGRRPDSANPLRWAF